MRVAGAIALIVFCGSLSMHGETLSAEINVSAIVIARAKLTVDTHPMEITVREEDVSRGFIEIPVSIRVVTNSPAGFLLSFTRDADSFAGVTARIADALIDVSRGGEGWLVSPYTGTAPRDISINYRLQLASTPPGVYRWPVAVAIAPQ